MPGPELPEDEVAMERAIAGAIRDVFLTVPHMGHVSIEPLYPKDKVEDAEMTQTDDPVLGPGHKITNFVEIGIPTVGEETYSGEVCTALTLTYPISYSLGVRPKWNKTGFPYKSSAQMFIGTYMKARRKFKEKRELGFAKGVVHYYLQQDFTDELTNQEGEATEHLADWSLAVRVTGIF